MHIHLSEEEQCKSHWTGGKWQSGKIRSRNIAGIRKKNKSKCSSNLFDLFDPVLNWDEFKNSTSDKNIESKLIMVADYHLPRRKFRCLIIIIIIVIINY